VVVLINKAWIRGFSPSMTTRVGKAARGPSPIVSRRFPLPSSCFVLWAEGGGLPLRTVINLHCAADGVLYVHNGGPIGPEREGVVLMEPSPDFRALWSVG
jgi:hypothetical protein